MRNRMEETDDWAMADAMANMDIASVSHDMAELATVEAALARLRDGDYGECADCGVRFPRPARCLPGGEPLRELPGGGRSRRPPRRSAR